MPGLFPGIYVLWPRLNEDVGGRTSPPTTIETQLRTAPPQNFARAETLKVRDCPGEMLLLPSADAQ